MNPSPNTSSPGYGYLFNNLPYNLKETLGNNTKWLSKILYETSTNFAIPRSPRKNMGSSHNSEAGLKPGYLIVNLRLTNTCVLIGDC